MLIANDPLFIDLTFRSFGAISLGPDGWTVSVTSPDSQWTRDFDEIAASEASRRNPLTPDEQRDIDLHRAAHCTLGWSPVTLFGGPFPFSFDNALRLYHRLPFVFEAVHRTITGGGDISGSLNVRRLSAG